MLSLVMILLLVIMLSRCMSCIVNVAADVGLRACRCGFAGIGLPRITAVIPVAVMVVVVMVVVMLLQLVLDSVFV